ncbi:MAG: AbrB/MazE/SpoVT family DNA-binding domain-containing protein [Candidatus Thermoplasmatota archaeon]|jgi:phosphate uptake regulator|nr:AbrB/MazE/SpoVT family DNA-binding domain-containing protein [Candidatus Thermoplasmatota archaeon]
MVTYTRRLQLTGGSTYIISLPSKWIRSNNLQRGSEIIISELDDSLQLSSGQPKKIEISKKIMINDQIDVNEFQRILISVYISGFNTLVIGSKEYLNEELREVIKRFSRLVMGIEIFEESSNSITLQNVLDSSSFPLSKAVRRMSLNVEAMINDTITGVENSEVKLLENVIERDDEVDRYLYYLYREVRAGTEEGNNAVYYLIFSRILERLADHTVNICKIWKSKPSSDKSNANGIVDYLKESLELFNESVEAFYSRKFNVLNGLIEKKGNIIEMKNKLVNEAKSEKQSNVVSSISEEILRIGLYSTDIAELAMDLLLGERNEITIGKE